MQQDLIYHISRNLKPLIHQNEDEFNAIKKQARLQNPWFDLREIDRMLEMIFINYLDEEKLKKWLSVYDLNETKPEKVVGIVAAGNIPLASFQDVWCALACGYQIQLKLSSKDQVLSKYIYEKINELLPDPQSRIQFVDKLSTINKLIASGSNLTANHFKQYEHRFPCLIRAHRNGIAILSGKESDSELIALGNDVFAYYGLGCRNVTKIYIPNESLIVRLAKLFDEHFDYVRDNFKYNNNFEYQLAILSLNKSKFYQNNTNFFNESNSLNSAISVLNYEVYDDIINLKSEIKSKLDSIQCICTNINELSFKTSNLGKAQWPELWDYQDDIDVVRFLQTAS